MPTQGRPNVVLETNLGELELELYWDHAPKVNRFISTFDSGLIRSQRVVRI
jgi:cyclophilin family peptidyl-prolyl cis-trans isomerase